MKRGLNQNLSGDEVYYTNSLIWVVENMLCGKLHCQKGFDLILFSYNIDIQRLWPSILFFFLYDQVRLSHFRVGVHSVDYKPVVTLELHLPFFPLHRCALHHWRDTGQWLQPQADGSNVCRDLRGTQHTSGKVPKPSWWMFWGITRQKWAMLVTLRPEIGARCDSLPFQR